jgi:hypothetical protein
MLIFDAETDGLLDVISKIHCIVIKDTNQDGRLFSFCAAGIPDAVRWLSSGEEICGHNILGFDIPAIQKFYPEFNPPVSLCVDTKILSQLTFPDIDDSDYDFISGEKDVYDELHSGKLIGSHSLKSWGVRLGFAKGDFHESTDWKNFSPEMLAYCQRDVELTAKLYEHLVSNQRTTTWWDVLQLEQKVSLIVSRQTKHGWVFDEDKAWALYGKLMEERDRLLVDLQRIFPPWRTKDKEFVPKRDNRTLGYRAGCAMTKLKVIEFNPNSRQHIVYWFKKRHRWVPEDYTDPTPSFPEGQPKVNEEILAGLPYPEAPMVQRYMMLEKRISQLATGTQAWLKKVNRRTCRIYGKVMTVGCVTRRMAHSTPNMAQIPNMAAPFGPECRELFGVPAGKVLVGIDAAALEARVQAHYQSTHDHGELIYTVTKGSKADKTSLHHVNMRAFELEDYDVAKTMYYALLYGAGDIKLGRIYTGTNNKVTNRKHGKRIRRNFEKNQPGYAGLKQAVANAVKAKGYLLSLDRYPLKVRSEHSALNTLFQSAGAIIMKVALVIFDQALQAAGLEPGVHYEFVGNIHDEWQLEVDEPYGDLVGRIGRAAIIAAGEDLGCRCPLDGEYRVGHNWRDTH